MNKEALKLALEALEEAWYHVGTFQPTEKAIDLYDEARTAIKEALSEPEQEPVVGTKTWFEDGKVVTQHLTAKDIYKEPEQEPVAFASHGVINWIADKQFQHEADLYTTPPQRKPLTDEEINEVFGADIRDEQSGELRFIRAIEAAHGIKE